MPDRRRSSARRRPGKHGRQLGFLPCGHFELLEGRLLLAAHVADDEPLVAPLAAPQTSTITPLTLVSGADTDATAKNPQSKVWEHDNKWWAVFGTSAGTFIYRLNGTSWSAVAKISNADYAADVTPVGNGDVTYALLYGGGSARIAKFVYSGDTYQFVPLVSASTPLVTVPLSSGVRTATLEVDSSGRMWIASQSSTAVEARWADAPYTTWSGPLKLATLSPSFEEITAIVAFDNKIGILWSDHIDQRYGFRYHVDGANPAFWSANEVPAGASAKPGQGEGMADDHLKIVAASDGTLYAAVKTAYDKGSMAFPEMALLVRRPNGTWDPLYAIDAHGTRGIVAIDEVAGFLRYIYPGETGVDDLVYKDIPFSALDPAAPNKFYSGPDFANPQYPRKVSLGGGLTKNPSAAKQPFHDDFVVLATNSTSASGGGPFKISGARIDDASSTSTNQPPVNSVPGEQQMLEDGTLVFSSANGNAITISDPDAGFNNVRVRLTISGGTATMGTAGLTVSGNGTSQVTATGRISSLNAALNGLVFTPLANQFGNNAARIEIFTDDLGNSGGTSRTDLDNVDIDITAVNDAPSFVSGADQSVSLGAGPQTVPGWASSISAGPNESGQILAFLVSNDNNALFALQPAVNANGTLTYTPAAGAMGIATVSVRLKDNGGTAFGGSDTSSLRTFKISIGSGPPSTSLAVSAGQAGVNDEGRSVVVAPNGNVFVTGTYSYADGTSDSQSAGVSDIFVAAYTAAGALIWQKTIGSAGDDRGRGIARDSLGNIYLTGTFQGTVDFDPGFGISNLTSVGDFDIFVLKLNAAGAFQWARGYGSAAAELGNGITVDSADNVLVTGQIAGAVNFNPGGFGGVVPYEGSTDIFVLKLAPSGGFQWAKAIGSGSGDRGKAIITDSNNRVYVTGSFKTSPDFDPGPGVAKLTSAGDTDVFVLRLNADGSFSTAARMGGAGDDEGTAIAVDALGNIYTTGHYRSTADFDPGPGVSNLTSGGDFNGFVSKLSPNGGFLFANAIGGTEDDRGRGLGLLGDGSVVVTGHFAGSVDFNPAFGTTLLTSAGAEDIFLARYSSTGALVSAQRFGGAAADMGRGLAIDAAGNVYLTGHFSGTVPFSVDGQTLTLTSSGKKDIFVDKVPQNVAASAAAPLARTSTDESNGSDAVAVALAAPAAQSASKSALNPLGVDWVLQTYAPIDDFLTKTSAAIARDAAVLGGDKEVLPTKDDGLDGPASDLDRSDEQA